jgi:hypothetical protein
MAINQVVKPAKDKYLEVINRESHSFVAQSNYRIDPRCAQGGLMPAWVKSANSCAKDSSQKDRLDTRVVRSLAYS